MSMIKGKNKGGFQELASQLALPVKIKTATATLLKSETGSLIVVRGTGAVTLTLPAIDKGLWYFILNAVDQDLIIAAPTADTLITFNDVAADSVDFDQAGNKIGAAALIACDGTSWIAVNIGTHTMGVNT